MTFFKHLDPDSESGSRRPLNPYPKHWLKAYHLLWELEPEPVKKNLKRVKNEPAPLHCKESTKISFKLNDVNKIEFHFLFVQKVPVIVAGTIWKLYEDTG